MTKKDKYVFGMDWGEGDISLRSFNNYRNYQYDLVAKYIGKNILEVGSGDRGFTNKIINDKSNLERILSIEPSETLLNLHKDNFKFPELAQFKCIDLFDLKKDDYGTFDTAIFIHVLEHIEKDKDALNHTYDLLSENGKILVEVPALPWLYSGHDEMLGHYRRYNKKMLRNIIDPKKFKISKMWYQDPIGVFGSWYFFKIKKIKLKSEEGKDLASTQGGIYDKYVIPFEKRIEKFITFPFGLSLTAVIEKI